VPTWTDNNKIDGRFGTSAVHVMRQKKITVIE